MGEQERGLDKQDCLSVNSIVSAATGRGIVTVEWGSEKGQLETFEARNLAMNLLSAADAAESDAFLVDWCRTRLSLKDEQMGALLIDFRAFRDRLLRESG
jgi:hypothetical protein